MNDLALAFYSASALADLVAGGLGIFDYRERAGKLRTYNQPLSASVRSVWNVASPVVDAVVNGRSAEQREAQTREALNDVEAKLSVEIQRRQESEARVAALAGVGDKLWRLGLVALLVFVGAALGAAGNLTSVVSSC